MKRKWFFLVLVMTIGFAPARSQSEDAQQLMLDWRKLTGLKRILQDMNNGYQILHTGYENIRGIAEGNFKLHEAFLNALLAINPAVKNYQHVGDVINSQASIVSEYQTAFNRFSRDPNFTPREINYLSTVYGNLLNQSTSDLDNLTTVLTAGVFRMSDDERLHAIDGIYSSTKNRLMFLRSFNNSTTLLAVYRSTESSDAGSAMKLYGLK